MIGRNDAKIVLSAEDRTRGAFASAKQGLAGLGSAALSVKGALAGLGLGVVGAAFVSNVKAAADYADEMGKLAARAGTTAEAISALSFAAKLSDVDNQTLARGLRELGNDAAEGGKNLTAIGVALADASGKAKTSEALFSDVADVIAGIEDPAKRAAVAAKLFGERVGPELLPLLVSGRQGIKDMTDEAARFGRVVTTEAAAKAAEFNDNLSRLSETAAGIVQQMAGPVVSSLATASSYFIKVANDVGLARAALISFGGAVARTLGVDDVGQLQSQARANQNAIALTVKQIETFQRLADRGVAGASDRVAQLREQYTQLQRTGAKVVQDLNGQASAIDSAFRPVAGAKPDAVDVSGLLAGGSGRASGGRGAGKAADDAKKAEAEFQKYLRDFDDARYGYLAKRNDDLLKEKKTQEADHLEFLKGFDDARFEYIAKRNEDTMQAAQEADKKRQQELADFNKDLGDDLRGALSAAFRDTANPLRAFGDAIANVVFTRVTESAAGALTNALIGSGSTGGNLISTVASFLSFDGGGYTGQGARAGGMDGRGGFMAMLHPNETVIDHSKGQGGSSQPITVIQNFTVGDVASVAMVRQAVAGSEQRIASGLGRSMRYGGALS